MPGGPKTIESSTGRSNNTISRVNEKNNLNFSEKIGEILKDPYQ